MYALVVIGQWKTAQISLGIERVTNSMYVCLWVLSCARLFVNPARLLCPWDFPGKNTGVGCHFLLQGIFPTQGLNPCLLCSLHWQADSLPLCQLGIPRIPNNEYKYTFFVCEDDASNSANCRLSIKNKVKPQGLTPEEMSDISQDGTHAHKLRSTEKNAWPSNFNWWKETVSPGSSVVCSEGSQEGFPKSS